MNGMFYGAIKFNQNISNWNVSKVTDMSYMFGGAKAFNQPLNNWNVSNVTYYNGFADDGCPINGTSKMPKF